MKKYFFLICIVFSINTLFADSFASKIFYVNLFNKNADVRLGNAENYIFKSTNLEPYSSTYMVENTTFGEFNLYFKLSIEDSWYIWSDDTETPYICNVEDDKNYCIVINAKGSVEFYSLNEPSNNKPKICFLNGSDGTMARMEVAEDWKTGTVAYTSDLERHTVTNFVSMKPGIYSLFWQYVNQVYDERYYFYPKEDGETPELFTFEDNEYSVFIAYSIDGVNYAYIFNITPENNF